MDAESEGAVSALNAEIDQMFMSWKANPPVDTNEIVARLLYGYSILPFTDERKVAGMAAVAAAALERLQKAEARIAELEGLPNEIR